MAITLSSAVTGYLTSVKNSLTIGSDLGSGVRGAAKNYLRAQDMSAVLDLLQEALSATTPLTSTGGSVTTVVDGAATFVANSQVGNTVVFTGNVTTELANVEAVVVSNSTTTLTFGTVLPAAVGIGDTYTIRATFLNSFISKLRQGKNRGDSPPGSVYGYSSTAIGGLVAGIQLLGGTVPSYASDMIQVHPGGQPGDNVRLSALIQAFQNAVTAFTVPT
jgi:hypothetical protein